MWGARGRGGETLLLLYSPSCRAPAHEYDQEQGNEKQTQRWGIKSIIFSRGAAAMLCESDQTGYKNVLILWQRHKMTVIDVKLVALLQD